jgi:hypothetical protein
MATDCMILDSKVLHDIGVLFVREIGNISRMEVSWDYDNPPIVIEKAVSGDDWSGKGEGVPAHGI